MKTIDINCIIDMSGSMSPIIEEARKGFNIFLKDQKNVRFPADAFFGSRSKTGVRCQWK